MQHQRGCSSSVCVVCRVVYGRVAHEHVRLVDFTHVVSRARHQVPRFERELVRLAPIILLLIFALSCTHTEPTPPKQIRIAAIVGLSGKLAPIGIPTKDALEAFEVVYNRNKPSGRSIDVDVLDCGSDPARVPSLVSRLLAQPAVPLIISSTSPISLAVAPLIKSTDCVLVANAGHPGITSEAEGKALLAFPSPEDECELLASAAVGRVFLIRHSDIYHDLGAVELYKRLGDRLVGEERFAPTEKSFSAIVERAKQTGPDSIIILGLGIGYPEMLRELGDRGVTSRLVVDTDFASNPLSSYPQPLLERLVFVGTAATRGSQSSDVPMLNEWIREYTAITGDPPPYYTTLLVDSLYACIEARERVDKWSQVASSLNSAPSFIGLSGQVSFRNGSIRLQMQLYRVNSSLGIELVK